jgi:hypothetical protein
MPILKPENKKAFAIIGDAIMGGAMGQDSFYDDLREALNASRQLVEAAKLEAALPQTFYADRPLQERVYRLADEWKRAIRANQTLEEQKAGLWHQVKRLTARYAIPENTLLCVGFDGGCDGDLEGSPHELFCPARAEDIKLRPHLYDTARIGRTEPNGCANTGMGPLTVPQMQTELSKPPVSQMQDAPQEWHSEPDYDYTLEDNTLLKEAAQPTPLGDEALVEEMLKVWWSKDFDGAALSRFSSLTYSPRQYSATKALLAAVRPVIEGRVLAAVAAVDKEDEVEPETTGHFLARIRTLLDGLEQ